MGQTGAWLEYWQGGGVRLVNFECTTIYIAPTAIFVGEILHTYSMSVCDTDKSKLMHDVSN